VIVWVQPTLLNTVAGADGVDHVLPLHDGVPDASYEVDIEIMELAHALRVEAGTIRVSVPYLHRGRMGRIRRGNSRHQRVGIVWQAGDWNPSRSVPLGLVMWLADTLPFRLHSLQVGPAAAQSSLFHAIDIANSCVERTVDALLDLDLLICVDTFVAHLAGALGVPVWLLLARPCDWRWGDSEQETSWYPTIRLFRQPQEGNWTSVVRKVGEELRLHFAESATTPSEQTYASHVRPE
jgi:hypothetical protein